MSWGQMRAQILNVVPALEAVTKAAEEVKKVGAVMSKELQTLTESASQFGNVAASASKDAAGGGFLTSKGALDLVDAYVKGLKFLDQKDFASTLYGPQVRMGLHELEAQFELMYGQFGSLRKLAEESYRIERETKKADDAKDKAQAAEVEKVAQIVKAVHGMVAALPKQITSAVNAAASTATGRTAPPPTPSSRVAPPVVPPVPQPVRGDPTGVLPS